MDFPLAEPIREVLHRPDRPQRHRLRPPDRAARGLRRVRRPALAPRRPTRPDGRRARRDAGHHARPSSVMTERGDAVVVHTPAYPPFFSSHRLHRAPAGRRRRSPAVTTAGTSSISTSSTAWFREGARTYLLNNPHNPTGRVFGPARARGRRRAVRPVRRAGAGRRGPRAAGVPGPGVRALRHDRRRLGPPVGVGQRRPRRAGTSRASSARWLMAHSERRLEASIASPTRSAGTQHLRRGRVDRRLRRRRAVARRHRRAISTRPGSCWPTCWPPDCRTSGTPYRRRPTWPGSTAGPWASATIRRPRSSTRPGGAVPRSEVRRRGTRLCPSQLRHRPAVARRGGRPNGAVNLAPLGLRPRRRCSALAPASSAAPPGGSAAGMLGSVVRPTRSGIRMADRPCASCAGHSHEYPAVEFRREVQTECRPFSSWSARAAQSKTTQDQDAGPEGRAPATGRLHPGLHDHPQEAELGAAQGGPGPAHQAASRSPPTSPARVTTSRSTRSCSSGAAG